MIKNKKKQWVIKLILTSLLSACATDNSVRLESTDMDFNGTDCISIRTIRDYTPLDNRTLLIEGPGKQKYYVRLVMPSFGLRSSFQLGVKSRDDYLCPYGGDQIVFGGLDHERVSVRSITRLNSEQLTDLLIRYGKIEPEEQPDPGPVELDGAEIEELGEVT